MNYFTSGWRPVDVGCALLMLLFAVLVVIGFATGCHSICPGPSVP